MSKVICDICGTSYPESEDFCPNCGCSQDVSADMDMELEDDNFLEDSPITAVRKQKEAAALEEAEQAAADSKEAYSDEEPEDEEEEEEESRGAGVAILLTVLIMLLLGAAGFLFLKFMLPNMELGKLPEQTKPGVQEQLPDVPTGPEIPCRMLALTSGGAVELTREGEYKLIHVIVKPEDTTDILTYTSSDESIVTVTEEGRLMAVAEGEAIVTISCGSQTLQCRVTVGFLEETEPPTVPETEPAEETLEETIPEEETESAQTEAPEETAQETTGTQLKDVTLKLGKTEFILPPGYIYTVPLDCDLEYDEIEWSIEHPYIASVDNGVVKGLTTGVTVLTAKYGDQTVTCVVRIKKI